MMGLFAFLVMVLREPRRPAVVLWGCWLIVFALQTYTSGIAWVSNHLGPGVVLGGCWFLVALLKIWPPAESIRTWREYLQEAVAVCMVILLFGVLGFVRQPRDPISSDFFRYVAAIEQEFQGTSADRVLMDQGSWLYLREKVLMKDRGQQISLHAGKNQEVNREALAGTIDRIEQRVYDKILVRQLDTGESAYDFQDRGSGVKTAILANYHEVRRIAGVHGIQRWWPLNMIAEIQVFVPNTDHSAHDRSSALPPATASVEETHR
jgi:hypothetical protein